MMEEEFEVTYLAGKLPSGVFDSPTKEILDIYIPALSECPRLRIRKSGGRYEITKKQPLSESDASHQVEHTIQLTSEEFAGFSQIEGKRVSKTRHYYAESATTFEVDIFNGELEGLVLVDVEFKDREAKDAFLAPEWFLADVTQEKFIAGGMLCGKAYKDIEEKLNGFGYKKHEGTKLAT